uniref:Retrovirus-related Pol polyprotein from transposon TNT 1-94 n=1 Tax=Tanacetum cinerariifolium TaxID=118510 RepID=A0A6L2LHH0_TANCI|nr:retrovirus-related Pol polyprotein from transposon TNT 1-94 [Tanacetum cinerariifolium]
MINSMLITLRDPHSLWGEACLAANTILNKISHIKSDKSPYQLWKEKQPSYKRMKVWGCLAKVLGYKSNVEDISNNIIIESAEADLFENIFPYKDKEKQVSNLRKRVMNDQLSQAETDNNSEVPRENVESRRSKRAKVTKDFGPDYMTYIVNEKTQTYKAAMESSEAPYWKEAIQNMGEADVILGIKIQKNSNGYILTQSHYIEKTLKKFRQYDDRPVVTPFDPKVQLKKNKGQSKFTSGYVFTLEGPAVSWKSSKQNVNTRSTMEA